jgi:FKBP-type peptidyl-prolyl cis-trans isomerase 2
MASSSPEAVRDGLVVDIAYVLRDEKGTELDRSDADDPLAYLHGAENIVPGLEKALTGHQVGDAFGLSWGAELAWSAPHKGPQRVNLGVFFESDLMAVGRSSPGDLLPYDDGDAAFYAALGLRLSTSRALRPRGARAD